MMMNVYTATTRAPKDEAEAVKIMRNAFRDGTLWTNAKSIREAASMAAHRAARNGWRGSVQVLAWTDEMRKTGHAYAIGVNIGPPEIAPVETPQTYASCYGKGAQGDW